MKTNNPIYRYWLAICAAAAALFGVQSHKNYKRDFSQQSFVPYVIAGIVMTVAFVLILVIIVNLVIA